MLLITLKSTKLKICISSINETWELNTMHDIVQDYYGKQLKSSADLKTTACCDTSATPSWLKTLLTRIHPHVLSRYYGCGLVCPSLLDGCRVLDLGCGSGRDVYALAQLVGPTGKVIGVDMTDEQLEVAKNYQEWHASEFGYSNVHFLKGYIEKLEDLDLEPASFDVIVSNCVINLSPDKSSVLSGIYRLLKPGGEFYFSDVYSDRRIPQEVKQDPILYGECLGGALYWNDFLRLAITSGFADPRLVDDRPLQITDYELAQKVGNIRFYSATYRLFKLDELESACEDYGQAVVYKGTIPNHPHAFVLDKHHVIETGRVFPVCGNTWLMLHDSRYKAHFDFVGDFSQHYGLFEGCGSSIPFDNNDVNTSESNSCC
jgi:SAM-dependent methyltransferase